MKTHLLVNNKYFLLSRGSQAVFILLIFLFFTFEGLIAQERSVGLSDISGFPGDTISVPVVVSNLSNIGALTIKIRFDENHLTWVSASSWHSQVNGALAGIKGSTITLAWDGINGMSIESGTLVNLNFIYLGDSTTLGFVTQECEIADIQANILSIAYTNAKITQLGVPSAPVLVKPLFGAMNVPINIVLRWDKQGLAKSYNLHVSKDSLFSESITYQDIKSDSIFISDLLYHTKYFWRVEAANPSGASNFSETWNFTTAFELPSNPSLERPDNNSSLPDTVVIFRWYSIDNVDNYRLQIAKEPGFSNIIYDDSIEPLKDLKSISNNNQSSSNSPLTDSLILPSKTFSGFSFGERYFWRVAARNQAGQGPFSEVRNFSISLKKPIDLAAEIVNKRQVKLTWTDLNTNEKGFLIKRMAVDSSYFLLDSIVTSKCEYIDTTVYQNSEYSYKITAFNDVCYSSISAPITIRVGLTSVDIQNYGILEYKLLQNYPNPFNPSTIIQYFIPKMSQVHFLLYNLLGEVVQEPLNSILANGSYELKLNGSQLVSGVYLLTMNSQAVDGSEQYSHTIKVVLVK